MSEHKPNARPRERSQPPVSTGERIALVVGAIVVGGLWIVGGWFFAVILALGEYEDGAGPDADVVNAIVLVPIAGLGLLLLFACLVRPGAGRPAWAAGVGALVAFVAWIALLSIAY